MASATCSCAWRRCPSSSSRSCAAWDADSRDDAGYGEDRAREADELARNILFDLAHAIGKSDARSFHAKMQRRDPIKRLSAGPVHFAHASWASVEISPESRPSPDADYNAQTSAATFTRRCCASRSASAS